MASTYILFLAEDDDPGIELTEDQFERLMKAAELAPRFVRLDDIVINLDWVLFIRRVES